MKPKHIPANCPTCDTPLVLSDSLDGIPEPLQWTDEWACPTCQNGIILDIPEEEVAELIKDEPTVSVNVLRMSWIPDRGCDLFDEVIRLISQVIRRWRKS